MGALSGRREPPRSRTPCLGGRPVAGGGPGVTAASVWTSWVAGVIAEIATSVPEKATLLPDSLPVPHFRELATLLGTLTTTS